MYNEIEERAKFFSKGPYTLILENILINIYNLFKLKATF